MRKLKSVMWIIIGGFIVLFIFQNQEVFQSKVYFRLNLWVVDEWISPEIPGALVFFGCFVLGFLVSYIIGLSDKFKARKILKELKDEAQSHLETIAKLEKDLRNAGSGARETVGEPYGGQGPENESGTQVIPMDAEEKEAAS